MTIQISGQRAAHRAVEAALPRPPLAQLPGRRIPGNNHRAVLAALDARTPEQIAGGSAAGGLAGASSPPSPTA